jgi:hypothetical protein
MAAGFFCQQARYSAVDEHRPAIAIITSHPAEVLYGYHLCLGTWPKCPLTPARDLTLVVRMANAIVANTPRIVDFVHLPMTKEADRQFCAPLAGLDRGGARVFLGVEWKEDGTRCCGGLRLPGSFSPRLACRTIAATGATPSSRCPNCLRISGPVQMRSAPAKRGGVTVGESGPNFTQKPTRTRTHQ